MDTMTQDITEDLEQAFGDDIDRLYSDSVEGDALSDELNQLLDAAVAVERFGMNPTAFGLLQTTHLLSGTSLDALAMENFSYDKPEGDETSMALEALSDKIKDTVARWSAKIISVAKGVSDKIIHVIGGLWDTISDLTKSLTSKAWDTAKAGGRTIKAHPFKTVMAATVAVGAVAGLVALVASGSPGSFSNENALQSFMYSVQDHINKIGWPGGSIVPKMAENASKITITINPADVAKASGTAGDLGWTASAVKAVSGQLSKAWGTLKGAASPLIGKVTGVASKLNDIGDPGTAIKDKVVEKTKSKFTGWISQQIANKYIALALWSVVGVITKLLADVVRKAFVMVKETFQSLKQEASPQPA